MKEKEIVTSEIDKLLYIYSGILIAIGAAVTIAIFCDGGLSAWVDYATHGLLSLEAFLAWGSLIVIVFGITLYIAGKNCRLTVTDKRVYGVAKFNARVDIPLDSVSAVGTIGLFKGISISSSSGLIKFWFIKNAAEIHKVVSELIVKRSASSIVAEKGTIDDADELMKFKDLLDKGIISQEEFDAKKKHILGL